MQMEYSRKDAEKLVAYYKPLLLGKTLEESTGYKIADVTTKTVNNSDFRVIVVAAVGDYQFFEDVAKVAVRHQLKPVDDVLSVQDQP